MAYIPTLTDIQKVRWEVQDADPALPVLDDSTYEYILSKNSGSISVSSIDAARMILMRLSFSTDEVVDILSIKGSKTAESWRYALQMYLKSPELNPIMRNLNPYAGGISKSDIATNLADTDQNTVMLPTDTKENIDYNPFMI